MTVGSGISLVILAVNGLETGWMVNCCQIPVHLSFLLFYKLYRSQITQILGSFLWNRIFKRNLQVLLQLQYLLHICCSLPNAGISPTWSLIRYSEVYYLQLYYNDKWSLNGAYSKAVIHSWISQFLCSLYFLCEKVLPVDEEWARDFHLDFQPVDLTLAPPHYHARYQPVDHCMSMFVGSETAHIQVKLVCRRMNNEHGIHLVCQCLGVRCPTAAGCPCLKVRFPCFFIPVLI